MTDDQLGSVVDFLVTCAHVRVDGRAAPEKACFFYECRECGGTDRNREALHVRPTLAAVIHSDDCLVGKFRAEIAALREQVARLTAPPGESDLNKIILGNTTLCHHYIMASICPTCKEIAQARRQGIRTGREQMREEAGNIARLYVDNPCSGVDNNTLDAFEQGMDHQAGAVDNAIAIEVAIRVLPRDPPGEEEKECWRTFATHKMGDKTMNIDDLTLSQIKSLATSFTAPTDNSAWEIGANYLIRTVTMIDTGRLVAVTAHELVIEDAAWIADTGRFADAVAKAEFGEVEPFPAGRVIIGRGAVIDATKIATLPRSQR